MNLIFAEKNNFDVLADEKMIKSLNNHDSNLTNFLNLKTYNEQYVLNENKTKILQKDLRSQFDYLIFPLIQRKYDNIVKVTNKSFVFFGGQIIANTRKGLWE